MAYIEPPGYPPFWAVTKHADIVQEWPPSPSFFSSASRASRWTWTSVGSM